MRSGSKAVSAEEPKREPSCSTSIGPLAQQRLGLAPETFREILEGTM